jgi:arylsulfatase A-like enzyme
MRCTLAEKAAGRRECDGLAGMFDLFPTVLSAAGIKPTRQTVLDGYDLLPLWRGDAPSRHRVLFGQMDAKITWVRDARWKLFLLPGKDLPIDDHWVSPLKVDGVTLLAPYDQARGNQYPGLRTGDETKAFVLFDLLADPGEQHNVAAKHPDVVDRLRAEYERMAAQMEQR